MGKKLCKVVYFDEDSVTDYVQIVAGGNLESTTELLNSRDFSESQKGDIKGKGGIGGVFKALLGWEASASGDVSAGLSFNNTKMVRNIVKNTILTDFLNIVSVDDKESSKKGPIQKFEGYTIHAEKDSLTYMVIISPYLSMLKSDSVVSAGDYSIALENMETALKRAKGYYEFVGTKESQNTIFRFNINAFKNNYSISDILKMKLCIYAIKVGETTKDMLNINKELDADDPNNENPSYSTAEKTEEYSPNPDVLEVFDVFLAGVESDD